MDFQFGAEVRRPDGGKLGELRRVIYDPDTAQLVSLVVTHTSVDGREVVVPIGTVNSADDGAVALAVTEAQFDTFEDFVLEERNIAPPPDAAEVTSDLIHDPIDVADNLPIGAATGIESIAFTPMIEELDNVPPGDFVLDSQTAVWATDCEVGQLRRIRVSDETDRVQSMLVERGTFFKHETEIPFNTVESVQAETIVLAVPSAALAEGES